MSRDGTHSERRKLSRSCCSSLREAIETCRSPRWPPTARTSVAALRWALDRLHEIARAAVVQEEDAAGRGPTAARSGTRRRGAALEDVVGEPGPMSCSARSENRLTGLLLRAATVVSPVVSVGVWQSAQPTSSNSCAAAAIESTTRRESSATGVGGRQEALEVGELLDGADRRRHGSCRDVVGHRRELAGRGLVTLGLEQLVGDAHLDVVGLAGEEQQRLVLSLPAEAGDRAVVAVAVRAAR